VIPKARVKASLNTHLTAIQELIKFKILLDNILTNKYFKLKEMNISKDVYEYLTNFADDGTILNMLSVDKTFSDEAFFERVMRRKYPLLVEFKKEDETWKRLFLRMVKYINILKEEFDIPYIPTKGHNPERFYDDFRDDYDIYNYALKEAAKGGHKDLVDFFIRERADDIKFGMSGAAEGGHKDLVDFFKKKLEK